MIEIKQNINPKIYWPDSKHIIQYAFSIGDFHYFQFHDSFNIPAERALSTIVFYREVDLNVSREYLADHTEAVMKCLTPTAERPSIEVGKALELTRQLALMTQLPKDTELLYKLASAVFFDQHEKPEVYEYAYSKDKIEKWKKEASLEDFFLQMPIRELVPYLQHAGENLATYDSIVQTTKALNQELIQEHLSASLTTKSSGSNAS